MASGWTKLFSFSSRLSPVRSPEPKRGSACYKGAERIDAWYRMVVKGMKRLEDSISAEAPGFSMDSLKIGVALIRSMLLQVHRILTDLWLPVRTAGGAPGAGPGQGTGDDVLYMYLEMNKTLLEIGVHVKEGVERLEAYEMGLEHALISMASAVDGLARCNDEIDAKSEELNCCSGSGGFLEALMEAIHACNTELATFESANDLSIWEKFVSTLGEEPLDGSNAVNVEEGGGDGSGSGSGSRRGSKSDRFGRQHKRRIEIHKKSQALQRSMSMMPPVGAASVSQMTLDITLVLLDAESIALFVSCMLLWVFSGSSDSFQNVFDLVTAKLPPPVAVDKGGWLESIFRLRDKLLKAEGANGRNSGMNDNDQQQQRPPRVNSLREFESLRRILHSLHAKVEELGLNRETAEGSTLAQLGVVGDGSLALLIEKSKESLAKLTNRSEELRRETKGAHLDIISSRKLIVDSVEKQIERSSTFPGIHWKNR